MRLSDLINQTDYLNLYFSSRGLTYRIQVFNFVEMSILCDAYQDKHKCYYNTLIEKVELQPISH